MLRTRRLPLTTALLLAFSIVAAAQSGTPQTDPRVAAPPVTVVAKADRVRFAAPQAVVQLRLEVYDETGRKLHDTEQRRGNVLDWHLQNGGVEGERVPEGTYLCVVTVKSLSGHITRKLGFVEVGAGQAAARPVEAKRLSAAQAQSVGAVEEGEALSVLAAEDELAAAVLAHDGVEGQLSRTRGALTFRVGDFFGGGDQEQMRLTAEGRLGVGTSQPEAALDVTGEVRATEGFRFSDGSRLAVDEKGALVRESATGDPLPGFGAAVSAATANRLAKFTDGAGTLSDSAVFESGGFVGIGTTSPEGTIHIESPQTTVFKVVTSGVVNTGRAVFQMYRGTAANSNGWDFGYNTDLSTENFIVRELTNAVPQERFSIRKGSGNVGIGTTGPTHRLTIGQPETPRVPSALVGVFGAGSAYSIARDTANDIEALVGADNSPVDGVNGAALYGSMTNHGVQFRTNNTARMVIAPAGNVGIGTTAPTAKLDVAGNINAATQYNIGGNRVLSVPGTANTFVGVDAGVANGSGVSNSFFGFNAGLANTTGSGNSFFGLRTGDTNTSGGSNSFFGADAGSFNSTGSRNSLFGVSAGFTNTGGNDNVFVGFTAGNTNTTGNNNTVVGASADVEVNNLTNATAIGHRALVSQNNSLVLGSINGVNSATADTNVGIGTTTPTSKLDVRNGEIRSTGPSGGIFAAHNPNNQNARVLLDWFNDGTKDWPRIRFGGSGEGSSNGFLIQGTSDNTKLAVLNSGRVDIRRATLSGTVDESALNVTVEGHLGVGKTAIFENTDNDPRASVLELKIGYRDNPTNSNHYIEFIRPGSPQLNVGTIRGNGFGGVELAGPGSDYAEYLPRLNPAEQIQPGELVGLFGGRVTKNTRGAAQVMAVSTGPIVLGNDPGEKTQAEYEKVAFIGQVMVRVRGAVKAGDFIVASGLNDGTGVAVSPERITSEQFELAVGQAWESSADVGVKSVRTAVGLIHRDPTVSRLVETNRRQAQRIAALDAQLTALESKINKELAVLKSLAARRETGARRRAAARGQCERAARRSRALAHAARNQRRDASSARGAGL